MTSPVRYTKGITNADKNSTMGQLPIMDPTSIAVFMEDFLKFNPED